MYYVLLFIGVVLFLTIVASREASLKRKRIPILREQRAGRQGTR